MTLPGPLPQAHTDASRRRCPALQDREPARAHAPDANGYTAPRDARHIVCSRLIASSASATSCAQSGSKWVADSR
ncbi:hypothetical protein Stube_38790 [Streptomyces tubercidicus]|uniref:Uncharacterized protein n=1 Tax=Streptomyces tubercidicus TaxID=47759 RepID=A0A640UYY8_9ACTN|nr:hypothetical protein Stube_38790 [Streptomyces tubercidicus]